MITDNNNEDPLMNVSEAGPETVQLGLHPQQQQQHKVSPMKFEHISGNTPSKNSQQSSADVLDKLISLTPGVVNKQPVNVVAPIKSDQVNKKMVDGKVKLSGVEGEIELEMTKLHELLEKQELASHAKTSELETRLNRLTAQSCVLKERLKAAEERETTLTNRIKEQEETEARLKSVMNEYQTVIAKMTVDFDTIRKTAKAKHTALAEEKDSALLHLNNVEAAFSDVHQKYEKCKKVVEDYKRNESEIKSAISQLEEKLAIKEHQLQSVQASAAQQVESMQREMQRMHAEHEHECTRLRAQLRKTDLKVISLQEALDQKVKENKELTVICDDLISCKRSA